MRFVLKPLVHRMEEVERAGLTLYVPFQGQPPPPATPLWHSTPQVLYPPGQVDQVTIYTCQHVIWFSCTCEQNAIVRERYKLEKYLKVSGAPREYIVHRLRGSNVMRVTSLTVPRTS